jgi:glycosyltransferase involved in cell wall biosynthesis
MPSDAKPLPLSYAIITTARNEEAYLEETIRSVVAQTVRPVRWIIVSDGSTDRTDGIVQAHAGRHDWISLMRMPERAERNFAAKAQNVNAAYAALHGVAFDLIANLDADVSFAPDYFEFLLQKFAEMPALGVAGTPYVEDDWPAGQHSCSHDYSDLQHVSGPCQLFRRSCFDAIGGYVPIKGGAVDWVAVRTARMKGWETRTFLGKTYRHHRKMGTAECGVLRSSFRYGEKAHAVGGHPAWVLLRGFFQMRKKPWIIGGLLFQLGFLWAGVTGQRRPVSPELMAFHRAEQMARLRSILQPRKAQRGL